MVKPPLSGMKRKGNVDNQEADLKFLTTARDVGWGREDAGNHLTGSSSNSFCKQGSIAKDVGSTIYTLPITLIFCQSLCF